MATVLSNTNKIATNTMLHNIWCRWLERNQPTFAKAFTGLNHPFIYYCDFTHRPHAFDYVVKAEVAYTVRRQPATVLVAGCAVAFDTFPMTAAAAERAIHRIVYDTVDVELLKTVLARELLLRSATEARARDPLPPYVQWRRI